MWWSMEDENQKCWTQVTESQTKRANTNQVQSLLKEDYAMYNGRIEIDFSTINFILERENCFE